MHTPGPWRVGIAGPNQCPTVGTVGGLMVAMVTYGRDHPTEANARLIAAAPDLLEALKLAAKILDINNPEDLAFESEWAGKIRAAIAKAEGKSK